VDQRAHATGQTAATAASGPTRATTAGNELALGFYLDSGFGDTRNGGSGFTAKLLKELKRSEQPQDARRGRPPEPSG